LVEKSPAGGKEVRRIFVVGWLQGAFGNCSAQRTQSHRHLQTWSATGSNAAYEVDHQRTLSGSETAIFWLELGHGSVFKATGARKAAH